MSLRTKHHAATLVASLLFMLLATGHTSATVPPPNPVLVFSGVEYFQANGKQWTRYTFRVDNLADYPNELFAAAPELPPCGTNTKSSRTWLDIYEQSGKRLYGFCDIGNHDGLAQIWFALESNVVPPSWVYIELTDRKTNTKYKSNLSDTVM